MRISDWSSDVCSSDLLAADDGAVVAEIAHDRHGDGRLAAARLADQADALALVQGHVEVDHRRDLAGAREVGETEVPALQDRPAVAFFRSGHDVLPQSRNDTSRRPSASRLKPRPSEGIAMQE